MKIYCLSLRQPWASLIVPNDSIPTGPKRIEVRKWDTLFRGDCLIHAGKTVLKDECKRFDINPNNLETGKIIGYANLTETEQASHVKWVSLQKQHLSKERYRSYGEDTFFWHFDGETRFTEGINYPGQLKFFQVPEEVLRKHDIDVDSIEWGTFK